MVGGRWSLCRSLDGHGRSDWPTASLFNLRRVSDVLFASALRRRLGKAVQPHVSAMHVTLGLQLESVRDMCVFYPNPSRFKTTAATAMQHSICD